MPQELDEVEGPEELIEGDLDELADDDDLIAEDGLALAEDDETSTWSSSRRKTRRRWRCPGRQPRRPRPPAAGEESDEEDEEEPDDEDVEASLDTILKERLVVEEVEDDEDTPEPEDRTARRRGAGPAQAARRVRLPVVLLGQAPQPAGGPEEDALPRLRVMGADHG